GGAAEPDIAGEGIHGDAAVGASEQDHLRALLVAPGVDRRVDVLEDALAAALPVAGRIALEVGIAPGEAVVGAEPDAVVLPVVEDSLDVAELLASPRVAVDHVRPAEDVVVDHADPAR